MRQHCWIELFSDYDCESCYHPGKANIVADALSRKERIKCRRVRAINMTIQSSIMGKILDAQNEASKVVNASVEMLILIMYEAHKSRYFIHPGADKMNYDLRDMYWWSGMKKDIALPCIIDFKVSWELHLLLVEFSYNNSYHTSVRHAPFKALNERKYRSSIMWAELGEAQLIGPEIVSSCLAQSVTLERCEKIQVDVKLNFVEEPVEILEHEIKKLKRTRIPIVKVDPKLFTYDIERTKTYKDYENELNDELKEPWSKEGVPYEICDHIYERFRFKNGETKWPTCNSNEDGFCDGEELSGMVRVGYMTYFQDHESYNGLMDETLKDEALEQKPIYEKS
nr:putative reverse transcriptase domain-containing protein [Tanacetum cinerariifolium]